MPSNGQRLTPLEMLAKLVSFDTESSKSNLPLIEFVEGYLQSWGVPYMRVPNETGDKAAVRLRWPVDGFKWRAFRDILKVGLSACLVVILTNGTVLVSAAGTPMRLTPNEPHPAQLGDRILLGRSIAIEIA